MSKKLWVQHITSEKTFIDKVSTEGCEDIADFLKEIKKEFEISGPSSHLTLYQPKGTTEIDVGDSPSLLVGGNSRGNPLIVKAFVAEIASDQDQIVGLGVSRRYTD